MIIFWGYRTRVLQLAMVTFLCGRCGNPSAHALRKAVMKFTLFFIPLFPINVKYSSQCTFCGATNRLTKEQALQVQAQAAGEQQRYDAQQAQQAQQPQQALPQQPQHPSQSGQ
jgi:glutaredoxin